jgi:UDP-2-acetamido-3-amino-2,3-dideoxy-glucuronate N-acetyltransferase
MDENERDLEKRFPGVRFYNPSLTEVQKDVEIGAGTRVGSFTLIHEGARIGENCTIGSHCNICRSRIGDAHEVRFIEKIRMLLP